KWGYNIGDELVVFAAPEDPDRPGAVDKTVKGMIDLRWKYTPEGHIEFRIEFRISPDDAPVADKTGTVQNAGGPDQTADKMVNLILAETLGNVRDRPAIVVPPPGDF